MGAKTSKEPCPEEKIKLENNKLTNQEFLKLARLQMDTNEVNKKEAIKFIKKWLNGYIDYAHKTETNSQLDFGGKIDMNSKKNKYFLCKSKNDCLSNDIKSLEVLGVKLGDNKQLIYVIQNNKIYYPLVLDQTDDIPINPSNKKCKKVKTFNFDD